MENFNEIVNEVLKHSLSKVETVTLDVESVLSVFYIKEHLNNKQLSAENIYYVKKIINTIRNNSSYALSIDIRYLIFWYLINYIDSEQNELQLKKDFFSVYIFFHKFENIIDNKELIKLIFPDDRIDEFLHLLTESVENIDFWSLDLTEKKLIIYKVFFITSILFERSIDAFKQLNSFLYKYFLEAITKDEDEIVFYLYTPLQFTWNGVSSTQEEFKIFNEKVEKKLEEYVSSVLINKYSLKPYVREINKNQVIKVVFLQERLINYSINRVFYSLMKGLSREQNKKFEFIVMDLNFKELGGSQEFEQEEIKKLGIKLIDCHKRFSKDIGFVYNTVDKALKIREWIIENNVDVLIGMHSRPEYNFLFTTRTSPHQIYWSHGNFKYMIDTIDKRITHSSYECYDSFSLPLNIEKYDPKISIEEVLEVRRTFPKDSLILGSIGRLVKIDNFEFLETVKKIILKNPKTVYLACGSGDKNSIIEKLLKLDILEYFYFPGHINSHIYGHVIDIWLESFPYGNGESRAEYYNKESNVFIMIYLNEDKNERRKRVSEFLEVNETSFKKACDFYGITIDEYKYLAFDISELTQAFNSTTEYIDKTNFLIKSFNDKDLIEKFKLLKKVYNYAWNMISKDSFEALLK